MQKKQKVKTAATPTVEYRFEVAGGLSVDETLEVVHAHDGSVVGFRNKKGETIRLVAAIEIESKAGDHYRYVTKESVMARLGLGCLDYDKLEFTKT